jgi:hypothetical protein
MSRLLTTKAASRASDEIMQHRQAKLMDWHRPGQFMNIRSSVAKPMELLNREC